MDVMSVVVEPISIDSPKFSGCCFAIKLAKPSQFDAAQIVGFWIALSIGMKFWFVVQTKGVNCFLGMEFKMYFTPSVFVLKQSHSSPVMVIASVLIFFSDMIFLRIAGKAVFFFHSGNMVFRVYPSDWQYLIFAPPISMPAIVDVFFNIDFSAVYPHLIKVNLFYWI